MLTFVSSQQLEQAVVKEVSWFRDTALSLEKLKNVHLDPESIAEQLYEQKVRHIAQTQHQSNDKDLGKDTFYRTNA